ncbi:MAG: TonB C-terminal domain-containing protein [Bacteroidales bacterium]|jgi:hypothetical protein|nr:TonB C-terminal domain-containing protein [Bacteroidales bacterium]
MKQIVFIFCLTLSSLSCFATAQYPDKLIYKGDTLPFFTHPDIELYDQDSNAINLFGDREVDVVTSCWRGYVAYWLIENSKLYLVRIESWDYRNDSMEADLKSLFGDKYIKGRVEADWVSGIYYAGIGKVVYYVHDANLSSYEYELQFKIKNGKIPFRQPSLFNNSKSIQNPYLFTPEGLWSYIYRNINWVILPSLNDSTGLWIVCEFSANKKGEMSNVKILRSNSNNAAFDKELVRVIKTYPLMDAYYHHGKFRKIPFRMNIRFNNELKEKYYQKE